MSTELMSIQEKIKAEIANIRNTVSAPTSNRIVTRDKKFTLPTGETQPGPLYAVILDHRNYNRYYVKDFDAKNPSNPDCFALAKDVADLSPENHEGVPKPQAEACAVCPMNEYGTAKQGKGKACRNMIRLALVAPDCAADVQPWTLEVPPTATKHFSRFVNDLEAIGRLPIQATARIEFDDNVSYPCPTFTVEAIDDDSVEKFWAIRERTQTVLDQPPGSSMTRSSARTP